jgi:hypothetical protein
LCCPDFADCFVYFPTISSPSVTIIDALNYGNLPPLRCPSLLSISLPLILTFFFPFLTPSFPKDIGSPQLLKSYESKRYYSNLSMMSIVDSLNTIFSIGKTDHTHSTGGGPGPEKAALFLRSAGMLGINSLGMFKGRIAKMAMGTQPPKSA